MSRSRCATGGVEVVAAPRRLLPLCLGLTLAACAPEPEATPSCPDLPIPPQAFHTGGDVGIDRGALAADLRLPTLDGEPFVLSEAWTGCDVFVFMPDVDGSSGRFVDSMWLDDHLALLQASPDHVHWVFFSDQPDARQRASALKRRFDALRNPRRADFDGRLHFIARPVSDTQGWLAEKYARSGYGFAIGLDQRIRDIGSLADPDRFSQAAGWFGPNMAMAANEAVYLRYLAEREAEVTSERVGIVRIIDEEQTGGGTFDVSMPEGFAEAPFSRLELDLTQDCTDPVREFGSCPEWDYLANLWVCGLDPSDADFTDAPCDAATEDTPASTLPCLCDGPGDVQTPSERTCRADGTGYADCACDCIEVGRWITTYHREGRWISDATHALPLLRQPTVRFRYNGGNSYLTTLDLRLSTDGRAAGRPAGLVPLFKGGRFDPNYNDGREPITVPIPADATRVELVALITGHGFGQDAANCAEFCNHTHHFTVNGAPFVKEHPEADDPLGCVKDVAAGTVPNQFGTWFFGRGGWCPGQRVDPFVADVTAALTPGAEATLTYEGKLAGEPYDPAPREGEGFSARIDLESYLLIWR